MRKGLDRATVAADLIAAKTVVAPKLGQFARDYPDVELDITTDDSQPAALAALIETFRL